MEKTKTTIQFSTDGEHFTEPMDMEQFDKAVEKVNQQIKLSGKQLMESPEMEAIAKEVLEKENMDIRPAEVGYLLVYPHLSKTTVARTLKNTRETKYYSGYDYLIEISGEAWDHLDKKTKYLLIYHELLHIQPEFSEKSEEWTFKLRPHDFADFYEINDKHGSDWIKTIQGTVSSLYDMNPKEEGRISL